MSTAFQKWKSRKPPRKKKWEGEKEEEEKEEEEDDEEGERVIKGRRARRKGEADNASWDYHQHSKAKTTFFSFCDPYIFERRHAKL